MADDPQKSADLNVPEAANVIADLSTYDEVLAFVGDDDRKGVVEAVDRRAADLAGLSPEPTTDTGVTRLGLPDSSAAQPGKPLEAGSGAVTVRVRWPHDSFEHGLKGVPTITAQGVEVDRTHAVKLNELAAKSGTELEEVE